MPRFTAAQHMKMTNRLLDKAAASKTPDRLLTLAAKFLQLALRSQRLTEVAHMFGFSDQAHFNHEIGAFAGCTPRNLIAAQQQWSRDAGILQASPT